MIPEELPHEKGYAGTGGRMVVEDEKEVFIHTGHVKGIKSESPVPDCGGATAAERTQQAKLRGEADVVIDKLLKKVRTLEAVINHRYEDASVEWWYRHEYVERLVGWGFEEDMAYALANKALSEHYLAAIYLAQRRG